jgi:hypothetical protein
LYEPDATADDHARYADELARSRRPEAVSERSDGTDEFGLTTAPSAGGTRRWAAVTVASTVALLVGLVVGAGVTLHITASTATRPAPGRAPTAARSLPVPRPLAGAASGTRARSRVDQQALARVLRLPRDAAGAQLTTAVDLRTFLLSDGEWLHRTGCSESTGTHGFSPSGLRSDLPGGAPSSGRAGTRFRLKIVLAKPSGWSFIASGRAADGRTGVVALGAGSSDSGSSQFVEFDTGSPTTITSLDIRSAPTTPFIWALDSCLPA